MSIVTLVSGGLDSTVMALLTREEGLKQYPLFIDYGQLNKVKEFNACQSNFQRHDLPAPKVVCLAGFGELISSGLTDPDRHILNDAFLPCRNLLFLTVGAAYAHQLSANSVAIGLLTEASSLFPDQTNAFLVDAARLISKSLDRSISFVAPLMSFSKEDVMRLAKDKGLSKTYSCHAGTESACGVCIACREYIGLEV